jgi:anaerobic selenocysteine-containing dehydrogenase
MKVPRRDLLKFMGGSAAGLALSPVPWNLLHDTAVWSENWPGIPNPPHGEIRTRYTTCTLCPAGCGVRARCVGDQPVSLAGVPGHPASAGALCAVGLLGHHLAFHPRRAIEPLQNSNPATVEEALAGIQAAIERRGAGESVAILDSRPGRAASEIYMRFLEELSNGIYCMPPGAQPFGAFGVDLENTRAILSFGEPVLDGWLSPGRVLANRGHFQLIQVEAAYSRTASLADLWVPVRPGAEAAFALDLANALKGGAAGDERVARVARILMKNKPAIAAGGGAHVAELNRLLGSVGAPGGFLRRREPAPRATNFADLPDLSVQVLIVDETGGASLPWPLIERKLTQRNPVVAALTPWLDGCARHANYVIPAPVYLEALDEVPSPTGSTVESFSLSPELLAAPPKLTAPPDFILQLAGAPGSYLDILKQRVATIRKEARGTVFQYADGKQARVSDTGSAEELWKALLSGAVWQDDPIPASGESFPDSADGNDGLPNAPSEYPLVLVAVDGPPAHGSPLMSKLYRESGLRRPANLAALHPDTGRSLGLEQGCRARIETRSGGREVQVLLDPGVMPGVIEADAAHCPGLRYTRAGIRRA